MLSENSIVSICSHSKGTQFQDFPKQDDTPTHSRVAAATPETLGKNCLWSSVISDPVTLVSIDWSQSPTKHVNVILWMFTLSCKGMTASYGEKKTARFSTGWFPWVFNGPRALITLLMLQESGEPANQFIWRICHYIIQGFILPRWLFGISEPSTVASGCYTWSWKWWYPQGPLSKNVFASNSGIWWNFSNVISLRIQTPP